jgi:hypothetical protein
VIWRLWSYTRATRWNSAFRGSPRFVCKTWSSWGILGMELDEFWGRKRFLSQRVRWLCLRHFLLPAFGYLHIVSVVEVLRRYDVQIHQLTPNAVVALAKYVWAVTSYGGQPSVEVFAKNYCLHWQKRKIGSKIAQFGSCTFTPRTGKTSVEDVELVPCARNKWGNWYDY